MISDADTEGGCRKSLEKLIEEETNNLLLEPRELKPKILWDDLFQHCCLMYGPISDSDQFIFSAVWTNTIRFLPIRSGPPPCLCFIFDLCFTCVYISALIACSVCACAAAEELRTSHNWNLLFRNISVPLVRPENKFDFSVLKPAELPFMQHGETRANLFHYEAASFFISWVTELNSRHYFNNHLRECDSNRNTEGNNQPTQIRAGRNVCDENHLIARRHLREISHISAGLLLVRSLIWLHTLCAFSALCKSGLSLLTPGFTQTAADESFIKLLIRLLCLGTFLWTHDKNRQNTCKMGHLCEEGKFTAFVTFDLWRTSARSLVLHHHKNAECN